MDPRDLSPDTKAVVLGRGEPRPGAPMTAPVHFTSTFHAGGEIVYARDGNPTWGAFEEVLGSLEGGGALAFASGLAAISAVVETLPVGATVVLPADAYNGTRRLLKDLAGRGRLSFRTVDIADTPATLTACAGADLLWIESPTNPLMSVADIAALAGGAHEHGALVAADNTFATPLLQRPLDLGVDVVVHSVTKLLAGHSDLVMGAVVARDGDLLAALQRRRSLHGGIPGPMEVFLALRGLRTLPVRLARAQATTAELATRLTEHPAVTAVRFPGLPNDPGYALATKQMAGYGAMLAFEVAGGAEAAEAVCSRVRLLVHGTSLGGVETLIERRGRWEGEEALPPGLLRLSVGLEDVDDLWHDLDQALAAR